ncbi:MAG: hypothetical protein ACTSYE_04870 [Alphaproteobacteria bacterium]
MWASGISTALHQFGFCGAGMQATALLDPAEIGATNTRRATECNKNMNIFKSLTIDANDQVSRFCIGAMREHRP